MYKTQKIMITAILLFVSTNLLAQTSKWTIGLEGGAAIGSLYGNKAYKDIYQPRLAYYSGLTIQYQLKPKLSIKSGLGNELKGAKIDLLLFDGIGQELGNQIIFVDYNYLTIPLLFRFDFFKKNSLQAFVNGGPYTSYLISSKLKYPYREEDLINSTRRFDAGLVAGAGTSIAFNERFIISVELRNHLGVLNLSKMTMVNNGAIKHNSLQMLLGLQYQL